MSTWELIDSWTFASNVPEVDFNDLTGINDLRVLIRLLTLGTSGIRNLRVSDDNGLSFYSASGDYKAISSAGVESDGTSISFHDTATTSARSGELIIWGWGQLRVKPTFRVNTASGSSLINKTTALNAIRVFPSGGGNITGGNIYVFGRT